MLRRQEWARTGHAPGEASPPRTATRDRASNSVPSGGLPDVAGQDAPGGRRALTQGTGGDAALRRAANEVISRRELLARVWELPNHPNTRVVDNVIVSLRRAFEEDAVRPRHILNVAGSGTGSSLTPRGGGRRPVKATRPAPGRRTVLVLAERGRHDGAGLPARARFVPSSAPSTIRVRRSTWLLATSACALSSSLAAALSSAVAAVDCVTSPSPQRPGKPGRSPWPAARWPHSPGPRAAWPGQSPR